MQYSALSSLLGTIYGGNGQTTFALPDLRGRVGIHMGTGPGLSPRQIGTHSGSETNTLSVSQLAAHTHVATLHGSAVKADKTDPTGRSLGAANSNTYVASKANEAMNGTSVTNADTGNNAPINNMQPYLTINWCVALVGIYPSRN